MTHHKQITFQEFGKYVIDSPIIIESTTGKDVEIRLADGKKFEIKSQITVNSAYELVIMPPVIWMILESSAKEIVLYEYPEALCLDYTFGQYTVYSRGRPGAIVLGVGETEESAWADAAKDLSESEE